jgi:hypothetical protein
MKNFSYHWKENIKPMVCFFIAGFLVACGFGAADWLMPKKPVEYRISRWNATTIEPRADCYAVN